MGEAWPSALHVIDARSPGAGLVAVRIAAALAAAADAPQPILFLGSDRDRKAARATAAETGAPDGTVLDGPCPPLGDPTLAVRPLRRAIANLEATRGGFARLVGWGVAASLSLALAMPGRARSRAVGRCASRARRYSSSPVRSGSGTSSDDGGLRSGKLFAPCIEKVKASASPASSSAVPLP